MSVSTPRNLISGRDVERAIGIPIMTLYRLARKGEIPYTDASKDWHQRNFFLFDLEEVKAALKARRRAAG